MIGTCAFVECLISLSPYMIRLCASAEEALSDDKVYVSLVRKIEFMTSVKFSRFFREKYITNRRTNFVQKNKYLHKQYEHCEALLQNRN